MYVTESYNYAIAVTASDTVNFSRVCDAIYTGSASNITVVLDTSDDTTVLFTAVPTGILPIRAKRINATATGTGPFVALYRF